MKQLILSLLASLAAVTLHAGNRAFDAVLESRDNPIKVVDSIATFTKARIMITIIISTWVIY